MIAICEFCGKEFNTFKNWYNRVKHHTCSRECACELKKKLSTKVCLNCRKEYYSNSHQNDKLYCSRKCARIASRLERIIKTCPVCNKEFETTIGGFYEGKACSVECGRKLKTVERCLKFTCTICGKEYYRTRYWVNKTKNKLSRFCSKKCKDIGLTGEGHPNYNPNKLLEKDKLREWSKLVKKRDHYTCQLCGSKKFLHSHHMEHKSKNKDLKLDINNGITLCNVCHAEQHKDNLCMYNLIINNKCYGRKKELDS